MTELELTDRYASFAAELASALTRSLEQAGAGAWQIAAGAAKTLPEAPALHYALTVEGELAGQCFVVVSERDAAAFAAQSAATEPSEDLLLRALESAAEGLSAEALGARGRVVLRAARAGSATDGARGIAQLAAADSAGATASLSLLFDERLIASLGRSAATPATARPVDQGNLGLVMDVALDVTLRFGQRRLSLREVLDLTSGSVVELDRQVDEPVELILDGKVIARGEAVIVDGNYGIRVTEVLQPVAL